MGGGAKDDDGQKGTETRSSGGGVQWPGQYST